MSVNENNHKHHFFKGRILYDGTIAEKSVYPIMNQHFALLKEGGESSSEYTYVKSDDLGRITQIPIADGANVSVMKRPASGEKDTHFLKKEQVLSSLFKTETGNAEGSDAASDNWRKRIQRLVSTLIKEKELACKNKYALVKITQEHIAPFDKYL